MRLDSAMRLFVGGVLLIAATNVKAAVINFGDFGDGSAATFEVPGLLTITGSGDISFSDSAITSTNGGLGVVDPVGDLSLDLGETMTFTFADPVAALLLTTHDIFPPGNVEYGFRAFMGALDLGFFVIEPHDDPSETHDLYALVGGDFDRFTLSLQESAPLGLVIEAVEFTTSVPVPGTSLLVLVGASVLASRRRHALYARIRSTKKRKSVCR